MDDREIQPTIASKTKTRSIVVSRWMLIVSTLMPTLAGLGLMAATIAENSATYDEVAYVRIACRWWTTGDQDEITRMGSPVTFWKWQGTPALIALKSAGHADWIAAPRERLPDLLPWFRRSSLWIWLVGLWATQFWAMRAYGHWSGAFAGVCYALGPNLRAHGALMTMEAPLWTFFTLSTMCLCDYVGTKRNRSLLTSAVFAGAAFSMKFTAVLLPFLAAVMVPAGQVIDARRAGDKIDLRCLVQASFRSVVLSVRFVAVMVLTNLVLTGFATIPLSERVGEHPWLEAKVHPAIADRLESVLETPLPVDWVGFLTQLKHQRSGGPSYLLGEVSSHGWPWYYLVTLLVKCPLVILTAMGIRLLLGGKPRQLPENWFIPLLCVMFLVIACAGSKRNYGYRYLMPLAPIAIVWTSALTQTASGRVVSIAVVCMLGISTWRTHPYELTYFNGIVGGPERGRWILADSNLDWGQGLWQFKRLLGQRPELADVTLYYFGDIEPAVYGINVKSYKIDASDRFGHLPAISSVTGTRFLAISTSLVHGPWGPPGYFATFVNRPAYATTPDGSIRVYDLGSQ